MSIASKKFAVLIINYNGKKYLKDCYDSLLKIIKDKDEIDIFLIDNGSEDDSASFTREGYPKVNIIRIKNNLGFSGAYNYTHKYLLKNHLNYDYYFILNNDTICDSNLIFHRADNLFKNNKSIAIISPTIIDREKRIQVQGGDFIFISGTTLGHNAGKIFKEKDVLLNSKWASGCAFFIREKIFEAVGGFDDYFMYQEDVGLSWKVLNKGYKIATDCKTSIIHFGGGTTKPKEFEHYYSERNRFLLYWQNLSMLSFVLVLPAFLASRIVLLLKQKNIMIAKAKLKGLKDGFALMKKYARNNSSFYKDYKIFLKFLRPISKL